MLPGLERCPARSPERSDSAPEPPLSSHQSFSNNSSHINAAVRALGRHHTFEWQDGALFSVASGRFQATSAWRAAFVRNWMTGPKEPLCAGVGATGSQGGGAGLFEMRCLILKVRMGGEGEGGGGGGGRMSEMKTISCVWL